MDSSTFNSSQKCWSLILQIVLFDLLKVPKAQIKTPGDLSFQDSNPQAVECPSPSLLGADSVDPFKKQIKVLLFRQAIN